MRIPIVARFSNTYATSTKVATRSFGCLSNPARDGGDDDLHGRQNTKRKEEMLQARGKESRPGVYYRGLSPHHPTPSLRPLFLSVAAGRAIGEEHVLSAGLPEAHAVALTQLVVPTNAAR
jgi:hypothetical protein